MPTIRIPESDWDKVWYFLVGTGPISRVSQEPVYHISERQLRLLKKKKLPYELISPPNGPAGGNKRG